MNKLLPPDKGIVKAVVFRCSHPANDQCHPGIVPVNADENRWNGLLLSLDFGIQSPTLVKQPSARVMRPALDKGV